MEPSLEKKMYRATAEKIKLLHDGSEYADDLVGQLDDEIIGSGFGLTVFQGVDMWPVDLERKVASVTAGELKDILGMGFMTATKLRAKIIDNHPISFLTLLKILMGFYPDHHLLKLPELVTILRGLGHVKNV